MGIHERMELLLKSNVKAEIDCYNGIGYTNINLMLLLQELYEHYLATSESK